MNKKRKLILLASAVILILALLGWYLSTHNVAVLKPAGPIGQKEQGLFWLGLALSSIVVVPVFGLTTYIAFKYRSGNQQAKYSPDWDHNRLIEAIWWGIPMIIIGILSVVAWNSSHTLDPRKSLSSSNRPLVVEAVALDWKWLFIYPALHVASVNEVDLPVNTPISFYITSDSVMNSFWIPNLGGQIYAMPGMTTQLHLMATNPGSYYGSSANLSGKGFAGMNFMAKAKNTPNFTAWLKVAKHNSDHLTLRAYAKLAQPSEYNSVSYYSSTTDGLFDAIVMKYMLPTGQGVSS